MGSFLTKCFKRNRNSKVSQLVSEKDNNKALGINNLKIMDEDDKSQYPKDELCINRQEIIKQVNQNIPIDNKEEILSEGSFINNQCRYCQIKFSPHGLATVNQDELIFLPCKSCAICKSCISNVFEDTLQNDENVPYQCKCSAPIPYDLFLYEVLSESLTSYIRKISKSSYRLPPKFICSCGQITKLNNTSGFFLTCIQCKKNHCLRCFQPHDSSLICIEYFQLKYKICSLCKLEEDIFKAACNCKICEKCYTREIKEQILNEPLTKPSCPMCSSVVPVNELHDLLGGDLKLITMQEDALLQSRFDCPICYKTKVVDGCITLYCKHRFCRKCIQSYLISELNVLQGDSTEIKCPICTQPISYYIIDDNLYGDCKERYQLKLLKNTKNLKDLEVIKFCNVCNYGEMISIDDKEFNCKVCNKIMCPNCNKKLSEDCCMVDRTNSILGEFKGLLVKCPKCSCGVIKESGCNFLKCLWPECQGVYFCYLCKKVLSADEHFRHYKNTGPFGNSCNTIDKIEDY